MADGSHPEMSDSSFIPGPDTASAFRNALGRFATGVTVVTTMTETGPLGMTANSFASVSLDPPLVLWSPAKASLRFPHFARAKHYAIHILAAEQEELCQRFARTGDGFDGVSWAPCPDGRPILSDCLVCLECTTEAVHEGGDHQIIVGEVTRATTRPGAPLLFAEGQFGGFNPSSN